MLSAGFSVRAAVVLCSTIYNYTLSFVMEEQAVFPLAGERSPRYSFQGRTARLDPAIARYRSPLGSPS
jgi:TetR/AcrR family transcriptional regulator, tetracycline repressor protein